MKSAGSSRLVRVAMTSQPRLYHILHPAKRRHLLGPSSDVFLSLRRHSSTTTTSSTSTSDSTADTESTSTSTPPSRTANPPSSTRPPPLTLPTRSPTTTTLKHLFHTGKAYLTFYKTSLSQIWTTTQLVRSLPRTLTSAPTLATPSPTRLPSSILPEPPSLHASRPAKDRAMVKNPESEEDKVVLDPESRAAFILLARWRHDIRRLPVFAVLFVVLGEWLPLVVLAIPRSVPSVCRIPRQVEGILKGDEARRRRAFERLGSMSASASASASRMDGGGNSGGKELELVESGQGKEEEMRLKHVATSLGLTSKLWDDTSYASPLTKNKVEARLKFLAQDDALLAEAGGVQELIDDEVRLACIDRGIDVLGKDPSDLRNALDRWMEISQGSGSSTEQAEEHSKGAEVSQEKLMEMLMTRPDAWSGQASLQ